MAAKKSSPTKTSPPKGSRPKRVSKKKAPVSVIETQGESVGETDSNEDETAEDDDPQVDVFSALKGDEALGDDEAPSDDETLGDDETLDDDEALGRKSRRTKRGSSRSKKSRDAGLATRDPFAVYMREVQRHSLLSREEEKALAVRYTEDGDVDAAARLVTANLRLVVKLAYEYRRAYKNMMDLIQEGNMGLMQAVKKFDPYRGVKLSSYAAWWIRAYMLRYILANWRMVKLGTTQAQRKLFFNLNKERARLSALGIEPSSSEVAKRLDVTEKEVEEMDKRLSRSDASLDTPVNEADGRQIARVELMPADGVAPDVATESAELGQLLRTHLTEFRKGLAGKDLIIFDERLIADDPRTLQDLGNQFGVSRERVRQLEARMTGKLREYLSDRIGDPITLQG